MEEIKLQSGAKLRVDLAPFAVSKKLYQSVLEEMRNANIPIGADIMTSLGTQFFLIGMSSEKIEKCVWECMGRAIYNDQSITPEIFEDAKNREDYYPIFFEVARVNLLPFTKSLYAQFCQIRDMLKQPLA